MSKKNAAQKVFYVPNENIVRRSSSAVRTANDRPRMPMEGKKIKARVRYNVSLEAAATTKRMLGGADERRRRRRRSIAAGAGR